MSPEELSNTFDVLYNNITSNQAPGLSEYEKSIFLTKGQDEVLKNYFNPKGNAKQEGYDNSTKRQVDFSALTVSTDITTFDNSLFDKRSNSKSFAFPSDAMFVINEMTDVTRKNATKKATVTLVTIPIRYDEYSRLMSKPYKRPLKGQAWRLIDYNTSNMADLVVGENDTITNYSVRYVKKPKPVITGDLDGLTINGYVYGNDATATIPETEGCELDSSLHEEILQRAVELAKIAWLGDVNTSMTAGQRSE